MEASKWKIIYKLSLVLIPMMIIVGILFLYFYQEMAFIDDPGLGYGLIIGIISISILIILITRYILDALEHQKKINILAPIFHGLFSLAFIAVIIIGSMATYLEASAINYNTGSILTWASDQDPSTEITVMWRTSTNTSSTVYYGTDSNNLIDSVSLSESKTWHQVRLEDLTPNTKYYYRVDSINKIHSFTTAPNGDDGEFTFMVFSDTRQNSGILNTLVNPNIASKITNDMKKNNIKNAFTIVCGDETAEATNIATWKSWWNDISVDTNLASEAAINIAVGNHERHEDCNGDIFANYYPIEPLPEFSYSFNYSSVHIQCWDPWNFTRCYWTSPSQEQIDWMEQDLNNSKDMKYKLIFMHPPPVRNGNATKGFQPVVDLCKEYGVDAVFFGHAHDFEATYINGTYYNLIGTGGNNGSPMGYAQVDVSPTNLNMTFHWLNGTDVDLGTVIA